MRLQRPSGRAERSREETQRRLTTSIAARFFAARWSAVTLPLERLSYVFNTAKDVVDADAKHHSGGKEEKSQDLPPKRHYKHDGKHHQ
jgi:hypothetical protein